MEEILLAQIPEISDCSVVGVQDGDQTHVIAVARHAMRTNSQLASELLARLQVPNIPGAGSGTR